MATQESVRRAADLAALRRQEKDAAELRSYRDRAAAERRERRDRFAAAALTALAPMLVSYDDIPEEVARNCVALADALMVELDKTEAMRQAVEEDR